MFFDNEIFHAESLLLSGKAFVRYAYRAVILKHGNLLMVYSDINKEYKFPGGGKESGESINETLIREVKEEVGYSIKQIQRLLGRVTEYNIARENEFDFFQMISEYYLVTIHKDLFDQQLDDYEEELKFEPKWVSIEKALQFNKETITKNVKLSSWIKRETLVLEELNKHKHILD